MAAQLAKNINSFLAPFTKLEESALSPTGQGQVTDYRQVKNLKVREDLRTSTCRLWKPICVPLETDENENGLISVPTCEEEFRYLGIQALIKMGVPYEPGRQSGRS